MSEFVPLTMTAEEWTDDAVSGLAKRGYRIRRLVQEVEAQALLRVQADRAVSAVQRDLTASNDRLIQAEARLAGIEALLADPDCLNEAARRTSRNSDPLATISGTLREMVLAALASAPPAETR